MRLKHLGQGKMASAGLRVLIVAILIGSGISSCKKLDFSKSEIQHGPGEWLHYDDGENFTGISANSQGAFDIAVRFTPNQLNDFEGFEISQVKFFPLAGSPATYSVTIWKGFEPPELIHQQLASVQTGKWNTENIDTVLFVDASTELWVGVQVRDYTVGKYPAGVDKGPAVTGRGDLYSVDGGLSWYSLSYADGLNYNWNLQVFLNEPDGQKSFMIADHE